MTNVEKSLKKFYSNVIRLAKKNLKRLGKNASGTLGKSLKGKVKTSKSGNSFQADLFMEYYGLFIDKGVKGVGGQKADGSQWKKKRVTNSDYSYDKKRPPASAFDKWSIRKGIAPRSKGGQFQKRRSINFAIANSVYHTGLETTNFLTQPFEKEFKNLPDEIVEAAGWDVEEMMKFNLKSSEKQYDNIKKSR